MLQCNILLGNNTSAFTPLQYKHTHLCRRQTLINWFLPQQNNGSLHEIILALFFYQFSLSVTVNGLISIVNSVVVLAAFELFCNDQQMTLVTGQTSLIQNRSYIVQQQLFWSVQITLMHLCTCHLGYHQDT